MLDTTEQLSTPVVKTPRGTGLITGQGTKIPICRVPSPCRKKKERRFNITGSDQRGRWVEERTAGDEIGAETWSQMVKVPLN